MVDHLITQIVAQKARQFFSDAKEKIVVIFSMCIIKIFRGEGVVDGEGGSSERCLKWGGGGWGVIKGSFQNILKQGVGKGKSCS